jgi:hypothetical protein
MGNKENLEENLIKSFNQMWGKFPESALLIHRDRTIIAHNEFAEKAWGSIITPRIKCSSLNPGKHGDCKANEALDKKEAMTLEIKMNERDHRAYWMPVTDETDYYIHFGIDLQRHLE